MGRHNLFVKAYLKNRRSDDFWVDFNREIIRGRRPFIRTGTLDFKDPDITPIHYIKSHIFINDGE